MEEIKNFYKFEGKLDINFEVFYNKKETLFLRFYRGQLKKIC